MSLRDLKTPTERRKFLQNSLNVNFNSIPNTSIESADNVHCENLIGATTVPLGVAGPLKINGDNASGEFFIPLATTEGALVASVSRGAKAITESGGVITYAEKKGTSRGPVFYTGSLSETKKLTNWIKNNHDLLNETAQSTSEHLKLLDITVKQLANYVFLRLSFDTQDAMGMNMVTIASQAIADLIKEKTGISVLSLAGNFDIDKKPSFLNFYEGRGFTVWAEVVLSHEILQETLKTTAEKLFQVWLGKNMLGSALSGSLGYNAHFANIIAALFIATGQDPAHVVEGSHGITTAKILENKSLYFSIYLPAVMTGTIGGGTTLPTQQEALTILGAAGNGTTWTFAEIVGGAVLAGELSLLASLSEGTLAQSHKKLGR